jgi:hypothetical protein
MPAVTATKYRVDATWDDVPHLTEEQKEALWDSIPPHQRKARTRGIPQLGSGVIYPVEEDRIKCDPFEIPVFWPKAYALDVGWKSTAAIWGAWDRQSDIVYLWSEYKQGKAEPQIHADAIKSRGSWIPGVIDPAARGRSPKDGLRLMDEYIDLGLSLETADNSVEAGLFACYRRMVSGRLKVFSTLNGFWDEFRLYRRDENGKVVKENDHIMDCKRYLIMSGMAIAVDEEQALDMPYNTQYTNANDGKNKTTGY